MRFTMRDGKVTLGYGVVTQTNPDIDIESLAKERKAVKKAKQAKREAEAEPEY